MLEETVNYLEGENTALMAAVKARDKHIAYLRGQMNRALLEAEAAKKDVDAAQDELFELRITVSALKSDRALANYLERNAK